MPLTAAHQPARHVADQEADLTALLQRAERVGAGLVGARHLQVDVLPRQEGQLAQRLALIDSAMVLCDSWRTLLMVALVTGLRGLADIRGCRHADHAVAPARIWQVST